MKYYVDRKGAFLGSYDGTPPEGGIEVSSLPDHGWDTYDAVNEVWVPHKRPLPERLNSHFKAAGVDEKARFYVFKAGVSEALKDGDVEAAKKIIENVIVPPDLLKLQAEMLKEFEG